MERECEEGTSFKEVFLKWWDKDQHTIVKIYLFFSFFFVKGEIWRRSVVEDDDE